MALRHEVANVSFISPYLLDLQKYRMRWAQRRHRTLVPFNRYHRAQRPITHRKREGEQPVESARGDGYNASRRSGVQ